MIYCAILFPGTTKIYDDDTFDLVAEITLTGVDPLPFVNDVIVTKTAAYFTDSLQPQIYKVGSWCSCAPHHLLCWPTPQARPIMLS